MNGIQLALLALDTPTAGDMITVVYARLGQDGSPAEIARQAHRPGIPDVYEIARPNGPHWQVTCTMTEAEFTAVRDGGEPPRWLHLAPFSQERLDEECAAAFAGGLGR